jgi:Iron only hydrogenase large subunit, C-terminal domain
VVAIVAPSILGQFSTTIEQVYGAFRQIGFTDIIEVAQGAMSTVEHEAHELIEKLEEGQKFMTTSCCPSYIELVNKYIPDMKKIRFRHRLAYVLCRTYSQREVS